MSDTPPAFLLRAADWMQRRLDGLTARPGGQDVDEDDEEAVAAREEAAREEAERFERRWGVFYVPAGLLVIFWLIAVSMWDRV